MKIRIKLVVEHDDGCETAMVEEIACLQRGDLVPETLGLTLQEGKELLAKVQETMVAHQAAAYIEQHRSCPDCGQRRGSKGQLADDVPDRAQFNRLCQAVREFERYLTTNEPFIPNYADRYQYGEPISTAFVESTVNEVISRRMVKQQQMRWTQRGAHLLLQVRTQALNEDLRNTFCRWYPGMATTFAEELPLAA